MFKLFHLNNYDHDAWLKIREEADAYSKAMVDLTFGFDREKQRKAALLVLQNLNRAPFVHVADIDMPSPDDAYSASQNLGGPWIDYPFVKLTAEGNRLADQIKSEGCNRSLRSSFIGDVLVREDGTYMVSTIGFIGISSKPLL